jgi:hypothetical protein
MTLMALKSNNIEYLYINFHLYQLIFVRKFWPKRFYKIDSRAPQDAATCAESSAAS